MKPEAWLLMPSKLLPTVCVCVWLCHNLEWKELRMWVFMCEIWRWPKWVLPTVSQREGETVRKHMFTHSFTHTTECVSCSVCVCRLVLWSNLLTVTKSLSMCPANRQISEGCLSGAVTLASGSLAVHPPWRLEVKDRDGGLEAGRNGCGGIASKFQRMRWWIMMLQATSKWKHWQNVIKGALTLGNPYRARARLTPKVQFV